MSAPAALDLATQVVERAADLARTAWDDVDASEALEVTHAIARARSLIDGAMLGIAGRLEETAAAEALGWASTKDFLTHVTGGHKGTGGGLLRAVEQLRDLPAVEAALRAGAISLPQARAIAGKVSTLPHVPEFRTAVAARMIELVDHEGYDASDLQTAFADVAREVDADGRILADELSREKQERAAHHARFLGLSEDGLGGVKVRGYCSVEDAERVKATLMPLAAPVTTEPGACGGRSPGLGEPLLDPGTGRMTATPCAAEPGCAHDGRDPRDHGRRMWDALVELCRRADSADVLPHDHGTTARIIVTIDHDSLRRQVIDAGLARDATMPSHQQLSAAAVRVLACDAEIIPAVLGTDSQVLDVGRASRLVTPTLWNALILRDAHCAFPGCTRPPIACDAHHVVHWADGGPTSLDNLMLVCRRHHTIVHNTPWSVRIDRDTGHPVWTAPPKVDVRDRLTYHRPRTPEEIAAAYRSGDPPSGRPAGPCPAGPRPADAA